MIGIMSNNIGATMWPIVLLAIHLLQARGLHVSRQRRFSIGALNQQQLPWRRSMIVNMSPYVPPEEDPEYRSIVKKSLLRPTREERDLTYSDIDSEASLPTPKDGDIVMCPGKWKGERVLGRVRFLQYSTSRECWIAEVSPLKEGKSEEVFVTDKNAKTLAVPTSELQPVRAYFVRSENGYRVNLKKNSTEFVLRAPKYRNLTADFQLPAKSLNMTTLEDDLERYEALKTRIVSSALQFGAVGTAISTFFFGLDVSIPFLFGSGAGASYLYLLGKRTDSIGAGEFYVTIDFSSFWSNTLPITFVVF